MKNLISIALSSFFFATNCNADSTDAFNVHIQTLAASCAACHGTNGNAIAASPVLAGLDASYFSKQMIAFRTGERPSKVMHRHAKGLTLEEIQFLAEYFSVQKRSPAKLPKLIASKLTAKEQ